MERDIIERLAIDQALGELNSDTMALFETYLAEHAEARHWAQAMAQTCTTTREALRRKTQPIEGNRHVIRVRAFWPKAAAWRIWGRWAAVIVISLALGMTAGRWSKPQPTTPRTIVVQAEPTSTSDEWTQVLSEPGQGFWEAKAVAMLQMKSEGIPKTRATYRSLWDPYRQSIKEQSYE